MRIETKRLFLYPAGEEEMRKLIKEEKDPEMIEAYGEMLQGCLDHPDQAVWYAVWFMELKEKPGTIIGDYCFKGLSEDGMVEIGYGLKEEFRGKGYMTETVKAASKWALEQEGVTRVEAETDPDNEASYKLLFNSGYRPIGECGEEGPRYIYRGDGVLTYRPMTVDEALKIAEIDCSYKMKRVWKMDEKGEYKLLPINWINEMLPYGIKWHYDHLIKTIENGGKAYGCFDGNQLVGYATVNSEIFGEKYKYLLLDQLFISNNRRNQGIGKKLLTMCKEGARELGADKLYLCAWSAEESVAFFKRNGCETAVEINEKLFAEDRNNIQLELDLKA